MKKHCVNLVLILLSIAFCTAVIEFGLRAGYPQTLGLSYQTKDRLKILRPGHSGLSRGVETIQEYRINSEGMRDRDHQIEKKPATRRILVLGDSFMEALQVKFEDSFPKLLEDALRKAVDQPVEVINAAVSGWGTDDELTYLTRYGYRFKPDLVLVATTLTNDVSDNLAEEFHYLADNTLRAKPVNPMPLWEYKWWQVKAFLASRSHFYQLVRLLWYSRDMKDQGRQLMTHVADQIRKEPPEKIEKGWMLTYALLRQIQWTAKETGARTAVVLIPFSIQLDDERLAEFIESHDLSRGSIALYRPQERVRDFGKAENIDVIDLLADFREWQKQNRKSVILSKDGHWNEDGHAVATSIVSRAIIERDLLNLKERATNWRSSQ